jgi:hypothetical protein
MSLLDWMAQQFAMTAGIARRAIEHAPNVPRAQFNGNPN